jgi:hypothetical protein
MAEKQKDVEFEKLLLDYGVRVWSDLTSSELQNIEGVTCVHRHAGYHVVVVDKRYSLYDIKNEIWRLAGYEPTWFGYKKVTE